MSTLYKEALADLKTLKEVAERRAQRAIIDAVAPRIREMIETEMLQGDEVDELGGPGAPEPSGELMTDVEDASAISLPDEDGKVTLDIDAVVVDENPVLPTQEILSVTGEPEEELELTDDAVQALKPVVDATKSDTTLRVESLVDVVSSVLGAKSKVLVASKAYKNHLSALSEKVQYMYEHVQKEPLLERERLVKLLNACSSSLEESKMKQTKKSKLTEAEVTMKLTGLPDDVDLDSVGVDLITDEEGETEEVSADVEPADGDDLDLDLDDVGGDEETEEVQQEARLSDDAVVEIDEGMLRREINRMRKLKEETEPAAWGDGVNADVEADFGGAKEEGDALDVDVVTENDEEELDEQDEQEDLDESDKLDQLGDRRKEDEFGADVADSHETATYDKRLESRVRAEKKIQERLSMKIVALKKEARRYQGKKLTEAKATYSQLKGLLEKSKARMTKLTESVKKTAPSAQSKRPAERAVDLRAKLAESNLTNAKLVVSNKLLQLGKMTKAVTSKLNEAKCIDDVKLVYKQAVTAKHELTEAAGSSRPTRSGNMVLTEGVGYEMDRWGKLAGISTK